MSGRRETGPWLRGRRRRGQRPWEAPRVGNPRREDGRVRRAWPPRRGVARRPAAVDVEGGPAARREGEGKEQR